MNKQIDNLNKQMIGLNKQMIGLASSTLDTTFKVAGIAAALVFFGKEAPEGSPLDLTGQSIVRAANSAAKGIIDATRVEHNVRKDATAQ